jgi:hypothetical protein
MYGVETVNGMKNCFDKAIFGKKEGMKGFSSFPHAK